MTSNALIYVRISQDRDGERAGVTRQREDCERRARERGWSVVALHDDNDVSAKGSRKRPGFEAMLADITAGRVGVVVAWSLDRLQRNRRDEVRLYEACQAHGVTISLINGPEIDFTTAAGRFVADSLGSVARLEIELKSDRQRRAVEQAVAAGKRVGGRRPFGYEADGVTINEREAATIRQGYEDLLAGIPLAAIARRWNAQGHTTGQGSPFKAYSVRQVLRNARNAGLRSHRGEVMGPAAWPGIVSEDTWRAAVAYVDNPARRNSPTGQEAVRLLTGIARCGVCGGGVHGGANARLGIRSYRCADSMGHFARKAEPVEAYVGALVVERLSRADAAALVMDRTRDDFGALHSESTTLRERLDAAAVDYADGAITGKQLKTITERINARLSEIDLKIADANRTNALKPIIDADDKDAAWQALPTARQRAIIQLLMVVTLHPVGRGTRAFRPETVGISWLE